MHKEVEPALANMVEQQIRTWEVLNQTILDAILKLPRKQFVPENFKNLAYADTSIEIGHGQSMMVPKLEARMLQALELKPTDKVLEVGTGSGNVTALLASLCKHVYSVDIFPDFIEQAEKKCHASGLTNITFEVGDAAKGWDFHVPYDVIAVTGSLPLSAEPFKEQLNTNGRLFAVIGQAPSMNATLIQRVGPDQWAEEILFETVLPPLINAEEPQKFEF